MLLFGIPLGIGAIKTGLSIASGVGSLLGGNKRQKQADKMQRQAVEASRQEDARREPLRQAANTHLLAPLGVNPVAGTGTSRRYGTQARLADGAARRVAGFSGLGEFQRVAPGAASNFGTTAGMYGQAGGEVGGAQLAPVGYEAGRARTLAAGQLEDVAGAPSRQSIALDRFNDLLDRTNDERTHGVRSIGQSAAKFGRLGSGMVTTDLGNLEDRLQTNLIREARGLSADTAAHEESDRLGRLNVSLGAAGQFRGEDFREGSADADLALRRGDAYRTLGRDYSDLEQIKFGQGAQLRNEARGERDAATNFRRQGLDADQSVLDSLSRREAQTYGQDASERDFTDRIYQSGLDNRLRFGSQLAGIGYRPPETSTLTGAAEAQGKTAAQSIAGAADVFGELLRNKADTTQMPTGMPPVNNRLAPIGRPAVTPVGRNPRRYPSR